MGGALVAATGPSCERGAALLADQRLFHESCSNDCGPCCVVDPADTCTGENICLGGNCTSAFGRNYQIVVGNGGLTEKDETGTAWDVPGGLPDPYVRLTLNNVVIGTSTAIQDTLSPTWNQGAAAVIPAGSTFSIDVFDEDAVSDDLMFSCTVSPLTADYLRAGGILCNGTGNLTGNSVVVYFVRQ